MTTLETTSPSQSTPRGGQITRESVPSIDTDLGSDPSRTAVTHTHRSRGGRHCFHSDTLTGSRTPLCWTSLVLRRSSREPGKSDPIDAEAVALAALRHPDLPVAELDGPAREVKLLSDHRHDLVVQRSRIAQQVRWHLHELDPDLMIPSRGLRRQKVVRELLAELERFDGVVARLARRHLLRCQELTTQINDLERELRDLVRRLAPSLLEIPGCGVLSAAVILGETAGVHRFRDKDAYARFTGTAPVPVWSGSSAGKVRLNRGGNRSVNCALHMIAVTQARGVGPGRPYLDKQLARGKDRVAALRLLRRRLSDVVFAALRADLRAAQQPAASPVQLAA